MNRSSLTVAMTVALACLVATALFASSAKPNKTSGSTGSSSQSITAGHKLFLNNCAPCHGANAQGDDGPSLHNLSFTQDQIASTIDNGFKGQMPAFKGKLKDADINSIAAYVHSLKGK
jgi:cytochrome c oxidase cbb3-type subunit 3